MGDDEYDELRTSASRQVNLTYPKLPKPLSSSRNSWSLTLETLKGTIDFCLSQVEKICTVSSRIVSKAPDQRVASSQVAFIGSYRPSRI